MDNNVKDLTEIERALTAYYQAPEPSEQLMRELELQVQGANRRTDPWKSIVDLLKRLVSAPRPRLAYVMTIAALALFFAVALIGPQNVLAQVQAWLGYVPGYGFVDVNSARILQQPVSQTQGEFTVTINQVVSNQDGTYVILRVNGAPPAEEMYADMQVTPENYEEMQQRWVEVYETDARLTLPGGEILDEQYFQGSYWDGYFTFPTLPAYVLEFSLDLSRLPGIPAGKAPEGWHFDLRLEYADEAQKVGLPDAQPVNVSTELPYGIRVHVLDVVYAPTETAIRVQLLGLPAGWQSSDYQLDARLFDGRGNEYAIVYGPNSGLGLDGIYTLTFTPLLPQATRLTLSIQALYFRVPLTGQSILVDVGPGAQLGDQILIGDTIDVLGFPVTFEALSIAIGELPAGLQTDQDVISMTEYQFEIAPIAVVDQISVESLEFAGDVYSLFGAQSGLGSGGTLARLEDSLYSQPTLSIGIPGDLPIPTGALELSIQAARIKLVGPHTLSWELEK